MRHFAESSDRPFSIGATRTDILADPAPWAARFAEERAVVVHDIFAPDLFDRLIATSRAATFIDDRVDLGTREVESPQRVGGTVKLLLPRAELLHWLESVTGRTGLAGADGRLIQARAGAGDALDWHNDLQEFRRALGITISFTEVPYDGGRFEMRRVGDPDSVRAFDHRRAGTALIFDLGGDLEHRVLPVTAGGPRRIFTGWFLRESGLSVVER